MSNLGGVRQRPLLFSSRMQKKIFAAIYQKFRHIYEDETSGKFLCLPDTTQVLSPEDVQSLGSLDTGDNVEAFERYSDIIFDFSRRMNSPIRGLTTRATDGEMLWDIYDSILNNAIIAKVSIDAATEKKHQASLGILFKDGELRNPSPEYEAYRTYRDRYFKALEECGSIQFSSALATGDEAEALHKKLTLAKAQLEDIQKEWALFGYKERIEEALNVYENSLVANPFSFWQKLKSNFIPELDLLTRGGKDYYATTYLFPTSFVDEIWDSISIRGAELSKLFGSSPDEIKSLCKGSDSLSGISAISFEYRSVRVERPWFNPNIFKSRLWRMPDGLNKKVSFGSEKLLGRFPAYVSALLLIRNGTITYSSGKTEDLYPSYSSDQEGTDQFVSILAYICKRIPESPNPDKDADWPVEHNTALLELKKALGGTIHAYVDGEEVDSGKIKIGETVKIKAVPNDGYILDRWTINGIVYENPSYTYECSLPENGLTVIPDWTLGISIDPRHFKIDRETLISINNGPDILNMDQSSSLSQVRIIAQNAFKKYTNLRSITIGNQVEIIEDGAFANCRKLETVSIPAATRIIGKQVFAEDNSLKERIFQVNPSNEKYTSLNGALIEKSQTVTVQTLSCNCGAQLIFSKERPSICPKCGHCLDAASAKEVVISQPEYMIPFSVTKEGAEQLVRQYYEEMGFTSTAFKEQFAKAEIQLRPVYAPYWIWNVWAKGSIDVQSFDWSNIRHLRFSRSSHLKDVSIPETKVSVQASRIIDKDYSITNDKGAERFCFEKAPSGTPFELYSKTINESRRDEREQVAGMLREKANKPSRHSLGTKIEDRTIDFYNETYSLLFNPFWVGSFSCNENTYSFYIDGHSGKVLAQERPPKNWKKILTIVRYTTIGLVSLVALYLIVALLFSLLS